MKLTFLFVLLFSFTVFSQQERFEFDEVHTYQMYINDTLVKPIHYLINSNNKNYYASASQEKDSISKYLIHFVEHGKLHSSSSVKRSLFYKAETFNVGNLFHKTSKCEKNRTHCIRKINDTIINNKTYNHYTIRHKKLKREKRQKLSTSHFITEKSNIQNDSFWYCDYPKETIPKGEIYIAYFENRHKKNSSTRKYIFQNSTKQKRYVLRDKQTKTRNAIHPRKVLN